MNSHIVIRVSPEFFEAYQRVFGRAVGQLPRHEPEVSSRMLNRLDRTCVIPLDRKIRPQ